MSSIGDFRFDTHSWCLGSWLPSSLPLPLARGCLQVVDGYTPSRAPWSGLECILKTARVQSTNQVQDPSLLGLVWFLVTVWANPGVLLYSQSNVPACTPQHLCLALPHPEEARHDPGLRLAVSIGLVSPWTVSHPGTSSFQTFGNRTLRSRITYHSSPVPSASS